MDNENTLPAPFNTPPNVPTPPVPGAAKAAAPAPEPKAPAVPKNTPTPTAPAPKAKAKKEHAELEQVFQQYTNLKEAWLDKDGVCHFVKPQGEGLEHIESKHYKAPQNVKK